MSKPTLDQIKAGAHNLYGRHGDMRQIIVCNPPRLVRHEDGAESGTWIDVSVFVPDLDCEEA